MNTATWGQQIREIVSNHWDQRKNALLLSSLPSLMKGHGIVLTDLLKGRNLAKALAEDFSKEVVLIRNEENPIIVGILPVEAQPTPPYNKYFPAPHKSEPRSVPSALWRAFTRPLELDYRRFVVLGPVRFIDQLETAEPPEQSYEVPREKIVGDVDAAGPLAISNVNEWLTKNGLDLPSLRTFSSGSQAPKDPSVNRSLALALAELNDADAATVLIPLNVVRRLLASVQSTKK